MIFLGYLGVVIHVFRVKWFKFFLHFDHLIFKQEQGLESVSH